MSPARSVDHADLQSEVSQVGHHHLLLLLTVRLYVRIDPVDCVVHDLQVPPRPRQVLWDHPSTRHCHRRAHQTVAQTTSHSVESRLVSLADRSSEALWKLYYPLIGRYT